MGSKLDAQMDLPRRQLFAKVGAKEPPRDVAAIRKVLDDRLPVETSKEIVVADSREVGEVTNLSLKAVPVALVERLDVARGAMSRNEFIKKALEYMVEHVELLTEGQ